MIHALHTNSIWKMGRLIKGMPQTAIVFLVGTLALVGIFPFSGYFSKEEIIVWVGTQGLTVPFFFLLITVFLTAFYMFRAFFIVFLGKKEAEGHVHESPLVMTFPMWILAIFAFGAGLFRSEFFKFLGPESELESHQSYLAYLSSIFSLLGIVTAWFFYQRRVFEPERVANSLSPITLALKKNYWLDDLYEWVYRKILDNLSILCGWFDRYIVDGFVNGTSWLVAKASIKLRYIQTGQIQDYLYGLIFALLLFALLSFGGVK